MNILLKKILLTPIWIIRLLRIARFSRKNRKDPNVLAAQWRNDYLAKIATKYLKMYNVKIKVIGYENLPKNGPTLIVSNHQSDADGFAILTALKKQTQDREIKNKIATFLAKKELEKKWKSKHCLRLINSFFIDRQNFRQSVKTLMEFAKYIKEHKTYGVIFPEGTRSKTGDLGEFKSGAFKIAKKEFLSIIPTTINHSFNSDDIKRSKKLTIEVIFHSAIKPMSIIGQSNEAIAQRVKTIIASKFIHPKK